MNGRYRWGTTFDWDWDARPTGVSQAAESVEDRWGDPELSRLLEKHIKYWKRHPLYLNQREQDLRTLDIQLEEYAERPAITARLVEPTPRYRRRRFDHDHDDDDEDDVAASRRVMGGGGSQRPCVMVVTKNPGRDENENGECLDRRGFAGEVAHAAQRAIVDSGRGTDIGVHVGYVAPFYPAGEWKGDVPDRIADLFSFYFKMRLLIARPKVVLTVGTYMGKFLMARCSVRSMKFVERPQFNHPFSIKMSTPASKTKAGSVMIKIIHIIHPFVTRAENYPPKKLAKNQADYAQAFDVLRQELMIGHRQLNAFSVLMGTGTGEEAVVAMTPPAFRAIFENANTNRALLATSGRPTKKEELAHLVVRRGIGVVITMTETPLSPSWTKGLGCQMVHIPVGPGTAPSMRQMCRAHGVVMKAWKRNLGVLIHCKHGVDRSVALAATVFMRARRTDPSRTVREFRRITGDPECLGSDHAAEFLSRARAVLEQMVATSTARRNVKREREINGKNPKPQLPNKKIRI